MEKELFENTGDLAEELEEIRKSDDCMEEAAVIHSVICNPIFTIFCC